MTIGIAELWQSTDVDVWDGALERYWTFVQAKNIERKYLLDNLKLDRIRQFTPDQWYDFLLKEYFRWKYTAPNRYATTTAKLKTYQEENELQELDHIRRELLNFDVDDINSGLVIACRIRGLGVAGGSGLLSLMYPSKFATVDQFVVKALREVAGLSQRSALNKMNPEGLSKADGVLLIELLREKAARLNKALQVSKWSPRMLEKVLWTYGR